MPEKLKINVGTLGNEEAPSFYSRYNHRRKLVIVKDIFKSPEEHFQPFFEKSKLQKRIQTLSQQFSAEVPKLHSTCPQEHFEHVFFKNYGFTLRKSDIWQQFPEGLSKLQCTCSEEQFEESVFFRKNYSFHKYFRTLSTCPKEQLEEFFEENYINL